MSRTNRFRKCAVAEFFGDFKTETLGRFPRCARAILSRFGFPGTGPGKAAARTNEILFKSHAIEENAKLATKFNEDQGCNAGVRRPAEVIF